MLATRGTRATILRPRGHDRAAIVAIRVHDNMGKWDLGLQCVFCSIVMRPPSRCYDTLDRSLRASQPMTCALNTLLNIWLLEVLGHRLA